MDNLQFKLFEKELSKEDIFLPHQNTIGDKVITDKVHVFTEWAPVKSLILGYFGDSSNLPLHDEVIFKDEEDLIPGMDIPKRVIERCQEIQNNAATELMKRGIKVYRVGDTDMKQAFKVGDTMVQGFNSFSPRDLIFCYHDSVIEFPSICTSRQHEHRTFNWILEQLRKNGSKWYTSYVCPFTPTAPLLDAAQLLRIGLDILVLVSMGGTYEGYLKVKDFFNTKYGGKVRVHPIINVYDGIHVDTTFTILGFNKKLQKYLVLVNPKRVTPTNMPVIFRGKNWAVLNCAPMVDQGHEKNMCIASTCIGMNIFILNSELLLMDDAQKELANHLNFYGIETIQIKHEQGRTVGGGMHCMTNDYYREEEMDFDRILNTPKEKLSREEDACYFDADILEVLRKETEDEEKWVDICNKKGIFATYVTDHLDDESKKDLLEKNEKCIKSLNL